MAVVSLPPSKGAYWDVPVDVELEEEQRQAFPGAGKSKCELVYGPYPPAYPVPKIDKKTDYIVPPSTTILFDIPIDYRDVKTPDNWIPRDGRLPRLLPKETPGFRTDSVLEDFSFITSPALHFVCNHHNVPRVEWESQTLTVKTPTATRAFNMDDILSLRPRKEFPVTLVSASFRGAELDALRTTNNEFPSSTCCIGTQIYKGVYLRSLLKQMGITRPKANLWVVAKGSDGYAVSIPLAQCINAAADVLLSYMVNGEPLHPDHGYPLRLVVPGWIGAYSVKWLQEVEVTDTPVLSPRHCAVPPRLPVASKSSWLDYRMTEVNLQCIMTLPKHGHCIHVPGDLDGKLLIGGFAVTGGGRSVTRIEVSLDQGATWLRVQDMHRQELTTARDQHWCWTWWKHKVKVDELLLGNLSSSIRCRAWDSASNTQPESLTWNSCGVGANHEYALRLTPSRKDKTVRIQHPIAPGDGWMVSPANLPHAAGFGPLLREEKLVIGESMEPSMAENVLSATFVESEVQSSSSESVEVTPEVSADMVTIEINGDEQSVPLVQARPIEEIVSQPPTSKAKRRPSLHTIEPARPAVKALAECGRVTVQLQQKIVLSRDYILLDFSLPTPDHVLGLPIGKHVFLVALIDGGRFSTRPYTPVSSDEDKGRVQFAIRIYRPTIRFPDGGRTSQALDRLQIGDSLDIRGPVGNFEYLINGEYSIFNKRGHAKCINMIAGGSGVTPMMQVAANIIRHPEDPTCVSLIYAARDEGDLILRSVFDQWAELFPDRFRVHYILSDSWPRDWEYSTGFVDALLFSKHLHPPGETVLNVLCGPPVFETNGCVRGLAELGHRMDLTYCF